MPDDPQRSFRTPQQQRLLALTELLGAGPAAFYRDALRLLGDDSIESVTHLVGHCFREIESAIQDVLLPEGLSSEEEKAGAKAKDSHQRKVKAILAKFEITPTSDAASTWMRLATQGDEYALHRGAHRDALMAPRPADEAFRVRCAEIERFLLVVLDRLEATFEASIQRVDALASIEAPTKTDLDVLRGKIPNSPTILVRFFGRIGPAWLPLLRDAGYLSRPPSPQVYDGDPRFSPWLPSAYLARIAPACDGPAKVAVAEVALGLATTDNPWVNRDLAVVAGALPPDSAEPLARSLVTRLQRRMPGFGRELAVVAERLACAGRAAGSLDLLRTLLELRLPEGDASAAPGESLAEPTYDAHEFELVLKRVPAIAAILGFDVLELACDSLERGLGGQRKWSGEPDTAARFRGAIEPDAADHPLSGGICTKLVDLARDCAEAICRKSLALAPEVVRRLSSRKLLVFERLALHIARVFVDSTLEAATALILDPETFDAHPVWRERRLLERDVLDKLAPADRERFFSMVRAGPDPSTFHPPTPGGIDENDPEYRNFVASWRRSHMALLSDSLPEDLRLQYASAVTELGPIAHPELLSWTTTWSGPTAPRATREVEAMSMDELVSYLSDWQPEAKFDGPAPSREGLSRALSSVVEKRPDEFARAAGRFIGQQPAYVRAVVDGLGAAARADQTIEWKPILDLCAWVLGQPREDAISSRDAIRRDDDPGWSWTRMSIARLLSAGMVGTAVIPDQHLDAIAPLLMALLSESETRGAGEDPMDRALNSIRGVATEAVVRLAVRTAETEGSTRRLPAALVSTFDALARDPNRGVRAMLGLYLPNLVAIDRAWVAARLGELLPRDPDRRQERDDVWRTYLSRREPTPWTFEILSNEYASDVDALGASPPRLAEKHVDGLIHHLVRIYWSGLIPLDAGLLAAFYAAADGRARAYVLRHMGFCFLHAKEPLQVSLRDRAAALWEARFRILEHRKDSDSASELGEFGWWFASKKFDVEWSLRQLEGVLNVAPQLELESSVAETLGELAGERPDDAMRILDKLVAGATDWMLIGCRAGIESCCRRGLQAGDGAAVRVRELVSRLAARGHTEFLPILSSGTEPTPPKE